MSEKFPQPPKAPESRPDPRIFWSAKTNGFYHSYYNEAIPEGSVEISTEEWRSLLQMNSKGWNIVTGSDGKPVAIEPKTES